MNHRPAWHIITCEYPPDPGGVSDYTAMLATSLAAEGEEVHVWCPGDSGACPEPAAVTVHRELGKLTPLDFRRVGRALDSCGARRLLVQWVPHGYGYHSMNLPFCMWIWSRAVFHGDIIELVIHEAFLGFTKASLKQNLAAAVHRLMIVLLLNAARCVWITASIWESVLRPYALHRRIPFQWVPVPSNIPVVDDPHAVAEIRRRLGPPANDLLIGHLGTYSPAISACLMELLPLLFQKEAKHRVILLGAGSEIFSRRLFQQEPGLAGMVHASGHLDSSDLSCHIAACDILMQPYPDGVSTRRTSAMAALAHGQPIVATSGLATEPLWRETNAVVLTPVGDAALLVDSIGRLADDGDERHRLGQAARAMYLERFDARHMVAAIRSGSSSTTIRKTDHLTQCKDKFSDGGIK